jgi:glutathione synthase/RimK-type ligase-like ATP-grasp enzyme
MGENSINSHASNVKTIAIHHTKGSFSERWVAYCEAEGIPFKIVDCYRSDIMQQLHGCNFLMWHFNHASAKDVLFARQLLYAVEASGRKVFPDYHTMWHFDDKVGQKYLLEGIGAPFVPTWVFYDKSEALEWTQQNSFPKVFKLRGGAGSANVQLARTRSDGEKLISKAFGRGFSQYNAAANLKERVRKYCVGKTDLFDVLKGFARMAYPTRHAVVAGRDRGYVYFQEFVSGNDHDIRVIVIGDRAFAIKRMVRENDFRASGSGNILYKKKHFDEVTIRLAFNLAQRLYTQCVAFDFVYQDSKPLLVEISYCFVKEGYDPCVGYWDKDLNWHQGPFNPYGWMINNMIHDEKVLSAS